MKQREVEEAYELNHGKVIECVKDRGIDPITVPEVMVKNHCSFSWGKDSAISVYYAVVMEAVTEMTLKTMLMNSDADIKQYVLDKHYMRKHGTNAYYG